MSLTLKQPAQQSLSKPSHDYSPPTPPATSRSTPPVAPAGASLPQLPARPASEQAMATPRRGLPPPAAMTLPSSTQSNPQMSLPQNQPMGQLPAPPVQWQGAEEAMRSWLFAKSEEDKRKQEEEKTRQEGLRLEQRKIEQDMLRTSLAGGIPPYMVPMIFAGMGGGNLANASLEWAQHFFFHQQQQQQQMTQQPRPSPPEVRRESRATAHPYPTAAPPPLKSSGGPTSTTSGPQGSAFTPGYQMSPTTRARQPPPSIRRPSQSSHLPRINTDETNMQQGQPRPGLQVLPSQPMHLLQQGVQQQPKQPQTQEGQPSPSLHFHHWQPPASQSSAASAPPPKSPDSLSSPRKRKATGLQEAVAPPPSRFTSPPASQGSSAISNPPPSRRRGHSRQRSNVSGSGMEQDGNGRSEDRDRASDSRGSTSAPAHQQPPAFPLPSQHEGAQAGMPYAQHAPRLGQERYDMRQKPAPSEPERYPGDARREELPSRRPTPGTERGDVHRPPPPETPQAPR